MFSMIMTSFRQRQRKTSFWIGIALVVLLVVIFTPQNDAAFKVLVIDPATFKQADNPSWLPVSAAIMFGTFLPIIGFSFIQNAVTSDQEQQIWNWQFSTPFSRVKLILSKYLANFFLLFCMLIATVTAVVGMSLIRFPGEWLAPISLLQPFILLIPSLFLVAAIALYAELIPNRQSTPVTLLFIFGMLVMFVFETVSKDATWSNLINITGVNYQMQALNDSARALTGKAINGLSFFTNVDMGGGTKSLVITPLSLTSQQLLFMGVEIVLSFVLALVSSILVRKQKTIKTKVADKKMNNQIAKLKPISGKYSFLDLAKISFKMIVVRKSTLLLGTLLLSWIVTFLLPSSISSKIMLPVIFLLLLPILAGMGNNCRELDSWLKTIPSGVALEIRSELLVVGALSIFAMIPIIMHAPQAAIQLILFALFIAMFSVLMSKLQNNGRFLTIIMGTFWFLYLNGLSVLISPDSFSIINIVVYGSLSILCFVGLYFYQQKRR